MLVDIWRKPAICLLESVWRMISRMLRTEENAKQEYDYVRSGS